MKTRFRVLRGPGIVRVSDARQDNVKHGTIEQQESNIRRFVKNKSTDLIKYELTEIIIEKHSASSGKGDNRKVITLLKELVSTSQIDFVVVDQQSRMTRGLLQFADLRNLFTQKKVALWEASSGRNIFGTKNSELLTSSLLAVVNENESNETKIRVAAKHRGAMVNNGKDPSPRPTLGLDLDPNRTGFYIVNEKELELVRELANVFISLKSISEVVAYSKVRGIKTKIWETKERIVEGGIRRKPQTVGGEDFDADRIKRLLLDPRFRGRNKFFDSYDQFDGHIQKDEDGFVHWYYPHGQLLSNEIIQKIDESLTVASKRKSRPKPNKEFPLLKDLVFDLSGNKYWSNPAKGGITYYCNSKVKESAIRAPVLEKLVLDKMKAYLSESDELKKAMEGYLKKSDERITQADERLHKLKIEITELEENLSKISSKFLQLLNDDTFKDALKMLADEKSKFENELKVKEEALSELTAFKGELRNRVDEKLVQNRLRRLMEGFDKKSPMDKRVIIMSLIQKILIFPESRSVVVAFHEQLTTPSNVTGGKRFGERGKWWDQQDLNL